MTTIQTKLKVQQWTSLTQQLRVDSIRSTTAAGSGHPTSSLSAAGLMAVLLTSYLRYDFENPQNPNNDHLIFSKGHASPVLYSLHKAAGAISDDELMTLRKIGSRLEGHPTPVLPWVDVATGSLGQGLPIGVGIALAGKYLEKLPYRIWMLLPADEKSDQAALWHWFALSRKGAQPQAEWRGLAYQTLLTQGQQQSLSVGSGVLECGWLMSVQERIGRGVLGFWQAQLSANAKGTRDEQEYLLDCLKCRRADAWLAHLHALAQSIRLQEEYTGRRYSCKCDVFTHVKGY